MSSDFPDGLLDTGGDQAGASAEPGTDEEAYERFTIFALGRHRLAIPVTDVDSILDRSVDVTRIPRSSEAIEGVTDIRGQITILVDPHVHFPDSGGPSRSPSLLVFADRDQPAAIPVDEVEGVEAVVEDNVFDQAEYDPEDIEGTALEHPLITGAIRVEHRPRDAIVESVVGERGSPEPNRLDDARPLGQPIEDAEVDESGVVVGEFSLEEDTDRAETPDRTDEDVEVEVMPILDVDRLLLASGRVDEDRDPVETASED